MTRSTPDALTGGAIAPQLNAAFYEADLSLQRLGPRLHAYWEQEQVKEELRHEFELRLQEHWRELFGLLFDLYGSRYDFFFHPNTADRRLGVD